MNGYERGATGIFSGDQLAAISGALSEQYARLYDAAPREPRARFEDDVLEFEFRDGLSAAEMQLRERGQLDSLRAARERELVVAGAQLALPVERLAHSQVGFHLGFFDSEEAETRLLFGFEQTVDVDPDGAAGLLNWSAEMRRRARELRRDGADLREASKEVRQHFRAQRAGLADDFLARRRARVERESRS